MVAKKKKVIKVTSKKITVVKKGNKNVAKSKVVSKKKTPVKKVAAKKVVSKKAIVKKSAVKKVLPKIKVIAKKAIIKKVAAKKTVVKKVAAKKASPKTKVVTKKVVLKKATPTKKTSSKKVLVNEKIAAKKTEIVKKTKSEQPIINTQKIVKVGVKTKKQLIAEPPQPIIEVSNHPKTKVKTILISQPKPENDKSPYYDLAKKYNLIETFRQFIKIEGLPVKEFRNQRIDILEHKAVILTSRLAVDHYFRMCNEMRVTVPESMKYFCINEATAYYLQKYIQYRKRKIFFGHQTIRDLVDVIKKNKEEKFLLPASDVHKEQICDFLDLLGIKYTKSIMYRTVSANLSDIKNLNDFDLLVFFTSAGINSLKHNFPNFKQGNTRIACFGSATAETLKKHGYRLDVYAPNPKNPSMSGAIDDYLKESNKR